MPTTEMINEGFSFRVSFDNAGTGGEVGYAPFVNLSAPDAIDIGAATFLGSPVSLVQVGQFDGGGNLAATHPLLGTPVGSGTPGNFFYVIQLPFGSFVPDQPVAQIDVAATLNSADGAVVGTPITASVQGGFALGIDALDNPGTDPPILGAASSDAITPTVIDLIKTALIAEDERATGPDFPYTYQLVIDVAAGETVTAVDLTDVLPNSFVYRNDVLISGGTGATVTDAPTPGAPRNAPNNNFLIEFGSITGTTSDQDVIVTYSVYINNLDANGQPVINASSGDDVPATNTSAVTATYGVSPVADNAPETDETIVQKSLAIQKGFTIATDVGGVGPTPGDTIEYTMNIQVSDYFSFSNMVVDDTFTDGQLFDSTFTPTFSINENGVNTSGTFAGANYTVTHNSPGDGSTDVHFNVFSQVPDGVLDGDLFADGTQSGGTTVTIRYRTVIQESFTDTFPSGDASVDVGDVLSNSVTVTGQLPSTQLESDNSGTSFAIAGPTITKQVYAIDGDTGRASDRLVAGHTITYRITLDLAATDIENLVITDYLPLPVLSATEVTTFDNSGPTAMAPVAGTATYGPSHTLHTVVPSTDPPSISTFAASNSIAFNIGTFDRTPSAAATIDILFTVTALDVLMADGLFLTNQAQATYGTTNAGTTNSSAIAPTTIAAPDLNLMKGVVTTTSTVGVFSPTTVGPVAFATPQSGSNSFIGGVTSSTLAANPINSNLANLDAGDFVKFAVVIENTGTADAFDVNIIDTLPARFQVPSGGFGMRLEVRDGDGNPIGYTNAVGGAAVPTDLFGSGIRLVDPSAADGALQSYDVATTGGNGTNIIVITYDLQVTNSAQPNEVILNTATIDQYGAIDGGNDHTAGSNRSAWINDATVTTRNYVGTKTIATTSEATTGFVSGAERVAIGEVVRYRLVTELPEGSSPNLQLQDRLPVGLQFIDDNTARVAFVANGAGISSTDPSGTLNLQLSGAGLSVSGNASNVASISPSFTLPDANVGASSSTSTDTDTYTAGTDVYFKLGNVQNADSDADAEFVVVEFNAFVLNSAAASNDQNDLQRNDFQTLVTRDDSSVSTTVSTGVDLRIAEPLLTVTKTATPTSGDAGDTIAFSVTFTNSNTTTRAPAFDALLRDILPAGYALNLGSVSTSTSGGASGVTNSSSGNTVSVTIATMPLGSSATVTYNAQLLTSVEAGATIANTANVTYTSLPGPNGTGGNPTGSLAPGGSGTDTGERNGSDGIGGAIDDYAVAASRNVNVNQPILSKTLVGSEIINADNTSTEVVIGELVTYAVTVNFPEGTTTASTIVDTLDPGLAFVGMDLVNPLVASAGITFTGSGTPTVTTSGRVLNWNLGTVTNTNTNNAVAETIVLTYQAIVLNEAGNQGESPATMLNNSAVFTSTLTTGGPVSAANVTVIEPNVTMGLVVGLDTDGNGFYDNGTIGDAGDGVQYTITLTNSSGVDAFDTEFSFPLPTDGSGASLITTTAANFAVVDSATSGPVSAANFELVGSNATGWTLRKTAASNIDMLASQLDSGSLPRVITLRVWGDVATTVAPSQVIAAQATSQWTSYNGTPARLSPHTTTDEERDGSNAADNRHNYVTSPSASFAVTPATISKSLFSTGEASTSGSDVTIGESATFALLITLPEGTISSTTVVDAIPAGLAYVGFLGSDATGVTLITTAAGSGGLLSADFAGTIAGGGPTVSSPGGNGGDATFVFGNISVNNDNVATNNSFVILVAAQVQDVVGNDGLLPGQTNLVNNATVDPLSDGLNVVTSNDVTLIVNEPELQITKVASVISPATADAGDVITYTLTIQHTGASTSSAQDLTITDLITDSDLVLIAGSVNASLGTVPGTVATGNMTSPDDTTIVVTLPTLAVGDTVVVTYQATVQQSARSGDAISNSANVTWDSLLGPGNTGRTGVDADATAFNVARPLLTKNIISTGINSAVNDDSEITIGEHVLYEIVITIPEGTTPDAEIVDVLDPGMRYFLFGSISSSAAVSSSLGPFTSSALFDPSVSGSITGNGSIATPYVVTFPLGDLTNTNTANGTAETITLRYMATAMNTADNSSNGAATGDLKNNSATFTWDLGGVSRESTAAALAPNVEIVEPDLQISNTLTTASPVDAGDAVNWTIVIGHSASSDADAYDATFDNVLPLEVQFTSFTVTHSTLGDISGSFEYDTGSRTVRTLAGQSFDLAFGETVTIGINGTVDIAAQPEQIITNQATTRWTSLNAGVFDGDEANERNGSGGINSYVASASNNALAIKAPSSSKSLIGTSLVSATNTATQGVIGETAQYRLILNVPEGTTNVAEWTDLLDLGLQFVQVDSVTFSPGLSSSQVTFVPSITGNGTTSAQTLLFDLGTLTNTNTNNGVTEAVTIDYTVRLANNAGNQGADPPAGPSQLNNTATFSWDVSGSPHAIAPVSAGNVEVIEPVLQLSKGVDDDTPRLGATLTYTLTIDHAAASDTEAFDIRARDTLPSYLTLNVGSISAAGATVSSNASSGNTIDVTLTSLSLGSTATITYSAVVTSNATDIGANINNTARIEWTSLAGSNANERTGTGVGTNDYFDTSSQSAVIIQPILQVTKQHTSFTSNGSNPLNWDVTVHVIAMNDGNVDLFNLSLLDDLQSQFGSILVSIVAPSSIDTTGLTSGGTAPTLDATWDGNLAGSGNTNILDGSSGLLRPGEWIALDFVVTVDPDAAAAVFPITNQVTGQAEFIDDAMTQSISDLSDSGSVPNSTNPGQPGDTGGTNDPTPLYVPDIAVTKAVVGIPTKLPNDNFSVTYDVVLKNTGTVNLSNLQITEDLVSEFGSLVYAGVLTSPSLVSGPSLVGSAAPTLSAPAWDGGFGGSGRVGIFNGTSGLLLPGDSIQIQFTVEVDPDATGTAQPQDNQVVAAGLPLDGMGTPLPTGSVSDLSDSGTDPSTTNPGADGDTGAADDPTPLNIGDIGLAKQVNNVTEVLSGIYDVQYAVVLENTGTVPVSNLQITEDLVAEFGAAFAGITTPVSISSSMLTAGAALPNLAVPPWDANLGGSGNSGFFNGTSGVLNPGDSLTLTFTAQVDTNAGDTTPPSDYTNQIDASARDPNGLSIMDTSDDGTNPNTNNTSGGSGDPSPFVVPMIRAAKTYGGITANTDGSYTVPVQIRVENSGTSVLTDLSLVEDIASEFGNAFISVSNPLLTPFGTYTGVLPLLNASWAADTSQDVIRPSQTNETLVTGEAYVFSFDVRVDPDRLDDASQLMFNQATAAGRGLNFDGMTLVVADDSGAGTAFDMAGVDNDQPSQLLIPEIRVVKSVAGFMPTGQDYTVTVALTVENTGSAPLTGIDLWDDLSIAFGPALVSVDAVSLDATGVGSGVAPTLNFGGSASGTPYDGGLGGGSTNLLNNNGTLQPGDYLTVSLTFTLNPEAATTNSFLNQATTSGNDPSSNSVSDLSDSGTNPNTSNPGAPNDSGGHNDPTPVEIPDVSVAKRVVGTPASLVNGNFSVVYEVVLQNAGTVILSNLQLTENLEAEFGNMIYVGVVSPPTIVAGPGEVGSVAPTLNAAWDGGLSGSSNTGLFIVSAAARLMPGDALSLRFTVEMDPDATGDSGFLTNQVSASGEGINFSGASLGVVTDTSDSGTNPNSTNPTAAGDMGTADDPTPLEIPDIGVAKQINTAVPTGVAGEFDVQYIVVLENTGTVVLNNLQLLEDLSAEFGAGFVAIQTAPSITGSSLSVGGMLPTIAGSWDGTTTNSTMLNGTSGILFPGDWFSVSFTARMDAVAGDTTVPNDFTNQVVASADGVTANGLISVSDLSDDGTNPNTNNGVGGTDDPTALTSPQMRVGKSYGAVSANADGTYVVPVMITVINTGTADIDQLTLVEDLVAEFGDALMGITSPQIVAVGGYSGVLPILNVNWSFANTSVDVIDPLQTNETLPVGEQFQFSFHAIVDPDAVDGVSQYLLNQAVATGMSVNFDGSPTTLIDESGWPTPDDIFGNDLDNPADLLIPEIRTTKVVTAISPSGPNWHVTFVLRVENTGSTDLTGLDLFDDLATQWGPRFLGVVGASLDATTVGLGTAPTLNFGSTAGPNPFDGGLTNFASANLLNNDGLMNPGEYVTLTVTVALDPDITGSSVYLNNQSSAMGDGPTTTVTDLSDDGVNPNTDNPTAIGDSGTGSHDDPTPLYLGDLGVSKGVLGSPSQIANGNFQVTYQVVLENTGTVGLRNLQVTEDFVAHFGAGVVVGITSAPALTSGPSNPASTPPTLVAWDGGLSGNTNIFDGLSGRLLPGDSLTITFTVEVDPNAGAATTYWNQVQAVATDPFNLPVTDLSDDGFDPNTTNPTATGDTGTYDDPTPLVLPSINVAKQISAGPTIVAFGSNNFIVSYEVVMMNTGNESLSGIDLFDDLLGQFGAAFVGVTSPPVITSHTLASATNLPTINPAWSTDTSLSILNDNGIVAPNETITLQYAVEVNSVAVNGMTLLNQARVVADDPVSGAENGPSDLSDDGSNPQSTNTGAPGDTGGYNDPTPTRLPNSIVGLAKNAMFNDVTDVITYDLYLEHFGLVQAQQMSLIENLDAVFGVGNYVVTTPTLVNGPSTISLNSLFNGSTYTQLFAPGSTMLPGEVANIQFVVTVNQIEDVQGNGLALYENQVTMVTQNSLGNVYMDVSTDGSDPDPDGDGDPTNHRVPTRGTLTPDATVGVAKSGTVSSDSNYVTYVFTFEHFGNTTALNVGALESLNAVFGAGNFTVASVARPSGPATFAANGMFNGNSNNQLVASGSSLLPGESATIEVVVDVSAAAAGIYTNTVTVTNEDADGMAWMDESQDGDDPDLDANGTPLDNAAPTVVTLHRGIVMGRVHVDFNNNGVQDTNEAGIPNVQILLTGDAMGMSVSYSTTTNSDGDYRFEALWPGTYTLTEVHPVLFIDGQEVIGNLGGTASNDQFQFALPALDSVASGYNFNERGLNPIAVGKNPFLASSQTTTPPPPLGETEEAFRPFSLSDGVLSIQHVDGDDQLSLELAVDGFSLTREFVRYEFTWDDISRIAIDTGGGNDVVSLSGSALADQLVADAQLIRLTSDNYSVELRGVEHLRYDDGLGNDRTTIFDTAGNDVFTAAANESILQRSDGSTVQLNGRASQVTVRSIGGSEDRAIFFGTADADLFVSRAAQATAIRRNSVGEQRVEGFEVVDAYANDRRDRAIFYDTDAADTFEGRQTLSQMQGVGFVHRAHGFAATTAVSRPGQQDTAMLYGSDAVETFIANANASQLNGATTILRVNQFSRVEAFSEGGTDLAYLFGTNLDEQANLSPTSTTLQSAGFSTTARHFGSTVVFSQGGNDTARFEDSAGDDLLVASPRASSLSGAGYVTQAQGFGNVQVFATAGGKDTAILYDSAGDDEFIAQGTQATMRGAGFNNQVHQFEVVFGQSVGGGIDTARLFDSALDDVITNRAGFTRIQAANNSRTVHVTAFDDVDVTAEAGGNDELILRDLFTGDTVRGRDGWAEVSGQRTFLARGFDSLNAEARMGHTPNWDVEDVDYIFSKQGSWNE